MGENALSLLEHLSSSESPLPTLTEGYTRPTIVFVQLFSQFFLFDFSTAKMIYTTLLALSVVLVWQTHVNPAPALKASTGIIREQLKGVTAISSAAIGGLVSANIVAVLMQRVLGKGMSWFAQEYLAVALYGPAALTGIISRIHRVEERCGLSFHRRFGLPIGCWSCPRTYYVFVIATVPSFRRICSSNVGNRLGCRFLYLLCPHLHRYLVQRACYKTGRGHVFVELRYW